jgi:hypothetical protein
MPTAKEKVRLIPSPKDPHGPMNTPPARWGLSLAIAGDFSVARTVDVRNDAGVSDGRNDEAAGFM